MRPGMRRSRLFRRVFVALSVCATLWALVTLVGRPRDFDAVIKLSARGANGLPEGLEISDSVTIQLQAGEVQSTVVPPGKKSVCPKGRLLISSDAFKHPSRVALLDLDNLTASPGLATFNIYEPLGINPDDPDSGSRRIKSNDHDLIALPNGDVLLIKMGQTRWPVSPKPAWFDSAYKLLLDKGDPDDETDDKWVPEFGPGARSEIFVWRSEDCGGSFELVSSIDTADLDDDYGTADDGSGGLPQSPSAKVGDDVLWQMGGTDGPLARVDPQSGRVFITIGLVGQRPSTASGPFALTGTELDRTVVMMSLDHGTSWDRAAVLPFSAWRLDVVPRANYRLAFAGHGWNDALQEGNAFVLPDYPIGYGILSGADAPAFLAPAKIGQWGWNTHPFTNRQVLYKSDKEDGDYMNTNVPTQTVLTRSPSSKNLLMAYPDTFGNNGTDGYRLYVYDEQASWVPFFPIVPTSSDGDSFVLHPTPVDAGVGPLLLYWYDVATDTKEATIRGRLITRDDQHTLDFGIARDQSNDYWFDVTKGTRFYGDYHTAGAYYVKAFGGWTSHEYHYYPVWIEPDGKVRVGHVTFNKPDEVVMSPAAETIGYIRQVGSERTTLREEVDLSRLTIRRTEEEDETWREVIRPEGQK